MTWSDKRVLVTGAGGFIGSHLAERLVSLGADVRCLVHYNGAGTWGWLDHSPAASEMDVVMGDVVDHESVANAMQGIDVVFHLAALIGIPYSYSAPYSYVRTNIEGTLNVLQAARILETPRIIHTSTSEVYGTAQTVPISEDHPLQGQSPYSASKIAGDKLAEAFHRSFGVSVVTVRPFNTYGPRQSARAIVPTVISQCLAGDGEIHLGNLAPTRDLTFVADTVEGFVRAGATPGIDGETINLGSGSEVSIKDLTLLIAELIGSTAQLVEDAGRKRHAHSEVFRLCSNNSKAWELMDWKPNTTLREGLSLTIDWIRQNLERYRSASYTI